MGTASCVQLQLYVFISEPRLSLNWDAGEKKKKSWTVGQRSEREREAHRYTHTGLMSGSGFVTLTSADTVDPYALEHRVCVRKVD